MARVIVDVDGVMYDFDGAFYRWAAMEGIDTSKWPPPTKWKFYQDFDPWMSGNEFGRICHRGVNSGYIFRDGDPYPGTADALLALKERGHTIHIVTARNFGDPGVGELATIEWIAKHNIPHDTLTFSSDKTVVHADYAVDDKPSNVEKLRAAGVDAYLMDRPWNQDADLPRVIDMLQLASLVAFDHPKVSAAPRAPAGMPTAAAERKAVPIATGVLDYFPDALVEVARVSKVGNDQHNPGQPLHWAKEKSTDEADALVRHLLDRGKRDTDGTRHTAKVAWRALALLQRELDAEGAGE